MKHKSTATGNAVLRAYNRAAKVVASEKLLATRQSAGFIMPATMPNGEGYQVFVQLVRFSEAKLKKTPISGGLLA